MEDESKRSALTLNPNLNPLQYLLRCEMKRGAFSKAVTKSVEFIVEASKTNEVGKEVTFTIRSALRLPDINVTHNVLLALRRYSCEPQLYCKCQCYCHCHHCYPCHRFYLDSLLALPLFS